MSGGLLFWTIVELCWSMSSQLTTCTSRVLPVLALYAVANLSQKALVWSLEYSAATSLIVVAFFDAPPPSVEPAPVPPPQAARPSAMTAVPAIRPAAGRCRLVLTSYLTSLVDGQAPLPDRFRPRSLQH